MMRNRLAFLAFAVAAVLGIYWLIPGKVALAGNENQKGEAKVAIIEGDLVTGFNHYLGQPVNNYAAPIGTFGFEMFGIFNSGGTVPLPLTPSTPKTSLLATFVDPVLLDLMGLTPADVNPASINLPLRQIPTNISLDGQTRAALPGILQAAQDQASEAEPTFPITLAAWEAARGRAKIVCNKKGSSVEMKFQSLIPNRLYTVWAIFGGTAVTAQPLGGAPNVFVTDAWGDAKLDRVLNFCPLEVLPGQRPLLLIEIFFHADNQNYGAVPDLAFAGRDLSLFAGAIRFAHLDFPITTVQ